MSPLYPVREDQFYSNQYFYVQKQSILYLNLLKYGSDVAQVQTFFTEVEVQILV